MRVSGIVHQVHQVLGEFAVLVHSLWQPVLSAMYISRIIHLVYKALWDLTGCITLPVVPLQRTQLEIRYHLYTGCTKMPFVPEWCPWCEAPCAFTESYTYFTRHCALPSLFTQPIADVLRTPLGSCTHT